MIDKIEYGVPYLFDIEQAYKDHPGIKNFYEEQKDNDLVVIAREDPSAFYNLIKYYWQKPRAGNNWNWGTDFYSTDKLNKYLSLLEPKDLELLYE